MSRRLVRRSFHLENLEQRELLTVSASVRSLTVAQMRMAQSSQIKSSRVLSTSVAVANDQVNISGVEIRVSELGLEGVRRLTISEVNGTVQKWDAATQNWRTVRPLTAAQAQRVNSSVLLRNSLAANDRIRWIPTETGQGTTQAFQVNYANRANLSGVPASITLDSLLTSNLSRTELVTQNPSLDSVISSSSSAGQSVPQGIWFPSGLDVVRDAITGRMAVPEDLGSAVISGSANSPVVWQDPVTRDALLYIGASNGGVYMRRYEFATNRWSDQWTWVSMPGTGYTGSQSIGTMAISPDGQYLAVGQGNASNYAAIGVPGTGIQIGKIQANGTINWVANSDAAVSSLKNLHIRSLQWSGEKLYASYWNGGFSGSLYGGTLVATLNSAGGIDSVITNAGDWNYVMGKASGLPDSPVFIAGHISPALPNANQIGLLLNDNTMMPINDADVYFQSLDNLKIARISVFPQLVNGDLILFIGSFLASGNSQPVSRIDRLIVDPVTLSLKSFIPATVTGLVGTNQAGNDGFYGNFAFGIDPTDPTGNSIIAGGNYYANYNGTTYAGGLVYFNFSTGEPRVGPYVYGPIRNALGEVDGFAPGQPHADSREVTFYITPNGPALIQTDDGGVWQFGPDLTGYWKSLSAPGLNTLEASYSDWNSTTNSIVSSYQDNAASIGTFNQQFAINVQSGDGQFAFFDDGASRAHDQVTSAYFAAQQYLGYPGRVNRVALDPAGSIISYDTIEMYYIDNETIVEFGSLDSIESYESANTPFTLPIEPNSYKAGDIVMAGRFNIYETAYIDPTGLPDSLVFQPLMPFATPGANKYLFNSLDNQGSDIGASAEFDSLYAGVQLFDTTTKLVKDVQIVGRQWNSAGQQELTPIYSVVNEIQTSYSHGQPIPEWLAQGGIVDLAHRSSANQNDVIYWLQGGDSISNLSGLMNFSNEQVLRLKLPDGSLKNYDLASLGIVLNQSDMYKLQALAYVPAVNGHAEYLVAGGQSGIWISELNTAGEPIHFSPMNWSGLPEAAPAGSYTSRLLYDPTDDLLVSTQLGQGTWLYSFTGQIGSQPLSDNLIHLSTTALQQQAQPSLDKRGNQMNTMMVVELNDAMLNPGEATDIYVDFENFALWQQNLDLVSPYFLVVDKTPDSLNLLTPEGQQRFGATLLPDGTLRMPLHFAPGVTTIMLNVNASEFPDFVPTFSLKFSASLMDGSQSAQGLIVLNSGTPEKSVFLPGARSVLDPFSPDFNPQATGIPNFVYPENDWVIGPIRKNLPVSKYSVNDIIYIGTQGNKANGGAGNDLLYVDDNTSGVNKLFGGAGQNEFRLVSSYYDLPQDPQMVMDFKPGRDKIGLVGVDPKDVEIVAMRNGSRLFVYGHEIGRFLNVGKRRLQNLKNFIFYN